MLIVDLSDPPPIGVTGPPGVVVAIGESSTAEGEYWLDTATFALTDTEHEDRRFVTVESVSDTVADLSERCRRWPHASAVCDDVLRSVDVTGPALPGIVTESLAYSTLQAGPEFARWLAERGPAKLPDIPDPVLAERDGATLRIRFNRVKRHNAFSTDARALLLEALTVALLDGTVTEVVLGGNGPSFCSGGISASSVRSPIRLPRIWPEPGTARTRARRTDPPAGPYLPGRDSRPCSGQRAGDGLVLRLGQLSARCGARVA